MRILANLFHILFLSVVLALLTVSGIYYLHERFFWVSQWINSEPQVIQPFFQQLKEYCLKYNVESRYGIGIVLIIVLLYHLADFMRLKREKISSWYSTYVAFILPIMLILIFGALSAIYYYPEDTISFGELFTIDRGPREEFLESIKHTTTLVIAPYLFLFISGKLYFHAYYFRGRRKSVEPPKK